MDISPAALRKMQHAAEGDADGVVDELGLLALHSGYADKFFPGTSVLQTRARYLFFVPWTYLALASTGRVSVGNVRAAKEAKELRITKLLKEAGAEGVIGGRVHPRSPAQPPDFAYWTALDRFGLYEGVGRSQLLSRWDRRRVVRREEIRVRDEEPKDAPLAIFDVPSPPDGWPDCIEARSFTLTKPEARRLRDALRFGGATLMSTAADALRAQTRPRAKGPPWEDPLLTSVAEDLGLAPTLERAGEAAYVAQIARAAYAAHVEELRETDLRSAKRELPEEYRFYREGLKALYAGGVAFESAARLDLRVLAEDLHLPRGLKDLLVHLLAVVRRVRSAREAQSLLLDGATRAVLTKAEMDRKGYARARLNPGLGRVRREGFDRRTLTVDPLHYRWNNARRFLLDLHAGLFQ